MAFEDDIIRLSRARDLAAAGPVLEELLAQLDAVVDKRIYSILQSGEELNPSVAVQAWYEKFAHKQLVSKIKQAVAIGNGAGKRLGKDMDYGS